MTPTRSGGPPAAVVVAVLVVLAAALTGCASPSGASGGAPAGITTVVWPTEAAQVREIVAAAPQELDGWTAEAVDADEDGQTFSVDYRRQDGEVRRPEAIAMAPTAQEDGPVSAMWGMLFWSGWPGGCVDVTGSPAVIAAMEQMQADPEATDLPAPSSTGTDVEWVACRSVVNVDGGPETLPPDEQQAILLWTGGGRLYAAIGRTTQQRDAIAAAMVAAARG